MTYEDLLLKIAEADERLVVMTAENRAAIRGLPDQLGERFIDTGITEMTMVGMAAGLAARGRVPVVHALATFLTLRAYEFVRTDVGIAAADVKLIGYVPGLLSEANGPTHQAIEDIAILRAVPGMRIFCPADLDEMLAGMSDIVADPHPWYVRYNDKPARWDHAPFELGTAEVVDPHEGAADVALITTGLLAGEAHAAAQSLRADGLRVRQVHLHTLSPLDEAAVVAALDTDLVVTVEDHLRTGGLYSIVCETAIRHRVAPRIESVALDSWFKPSLLDRVMAHHELDAPAIVRRVKSSLSGLETQHG